MATPKNQIAQAVAELRELRPHLVELHFCGRYVPVCKCVFHVCAEFHELYKQINCLFVATICGNFVICALALPLPERALTSSVSVLCSLRGWLLTRPLHDLAHSLV